MEVADTLILKPYEKHPLEDPLRELAHLCSQCHHRNAIKNFMMEFRLGRVFDDKEGGVHISGRDEDILYKVIAPA
jgi:formate-dependent nitrite reductase cytochrome c552 subunit